MSFIKTRDCNGSCCVKDPQFPNEHRICTYLDDGKCKLMVNPDLLKDFTDSDYKKFTTACRDWPHNRPKRNTGDCCWQWVDD